MNLEPNARKFSQLVPTGRDPHNLSRRDGIFTFPNPLSTNILTIQQLSIDFATETGNMRVVDSINFSLSRGSALGIVGESGSGKSVTSLAIMGLLPKPGGHVAQGSVVFHELNGDSIHLTGLSEKQMQQWRGKRIAMIFQEPMTSLNPSMRCGKQVMEIMLNHEKISKTEAKNRTLELFSEVMLPDPHRAFNAYPHQISGGQKQRVMIAMALACKPDILIADEPTTALDVTVQKTILELLRTVQQKYNLSLIFISHNLDVIAEICNSVVVMYKGKIVESGAVKQIFNNPQHPYTKGLLACRPPHSLRPKRLKVIADFVNEPTSSEVELVSSKARADLHKQLYAHSPILSTQNLTTLFVTRSNIFGKATQHYKAVNEVSFDIFRGETLGLVGESGCGKTTLGRSILRLVEPHSGNVIYDNVELNKLKVAAMRQMRKRMQIVFQDPYSSLNPRLTVGEAILEPMRVYKLHQNESGRKAKAEWLLQKVGLEPSHMGRYPHEFSGGQRQRICIARALAVEPEFIICDESVSALDVSVQAQVLNLLNDLKTEFGLTYLFISHDLSVVRYMSDRIMVMNKGQIVETGEADALYAQPMSEYTRKLLNSIPRGL